MAPITRGMPNTVSSVFQPYHHHHHHLQFKSFENILTGLGRKPFENIVEKEKLLVQAISPFPTMFYTLSKTEIIIFVKFNLLSANAFNLVWSKVLSCGNGFL